MRAAALVYSTALVSLVAVAGCLQYDGASTPLEVLGLSADVVLPLEPVTVQFTAPVASWPNIIVMKGEQPVPVQVMTQEQQVVLRPESAWPELAALKIQVDGPVVGTHGQVWTPEHGLMGTFMVGPKPGAEDSPLTLLGPWQGPANLQWLLVSGAHADIEAMGSVFLTGHGPPRPGRVHSRAAGRALVQLEPWPSCEEGCLPRSFGVQVMPQGLQLGTVQTSSQADRTAPRVLWVHAAVRGDGVMVQVFADEPVVVQGSLHPQAGPVVALEPPLQVATEVRLAAVGALQPSTRYRVVIEVWDLAGNRGEAPLVEVRTADVPQVRISEVVLVPLRDWSDSDGSGTFFDPWPGLGAVNDNDEWVELVNLSDRAVDLLQAGLELRALDGSPSVTPVDAAPALYFGAGGSVRSWKPGEALVVRPRGSLSQRELRLELYGSGALLDTLQIGGAGQVDHPGGGLLDTVHEAIARDGHGAWRWCVPSPGDPAAATTCR